MGFIQECTCCQRLHIKVRIRHLFIMEYVRYLDNFVRNILQVKLGAIISIIYPFSRYFDFIFRPGVFGTIVACLEPLFYTLKLVLSEVFFPFTQMFKLIKVTGILLLDIITPIFTFGIEIFKLVFSLIKLVFYLPSISLMKVALLFKDGFVGFILITKELVAFFKGFIVPIANP